MLESERDLSKEDRKKNDVSYEAGHHFDNLYDQNEDAAGNLVNEATGKKINNSKNDRGPLSLRVIKGLPKLRKENDAAAKWLRERGLE